MCDTNLIPDIIEIGKQAARQEVDYLKRLLETTS
jgi:hypothetical protein